jgi:hypothetical protein
MVGSRSHQGRANGFLQGHKTDLQKRNNCFRLNERVCLKNTKSSKIETDRNKNVNTAFHKSKNIRTIGPGFSADKTVTEDRILKRGHGHLLL